jgi:hypothetical protein
MSIMLSSLAAAQLPARPPNRRTAAGVLPCLEAVEKIADRLREHGVPIGLK